MPAGSEGIGLSVGVGEALAAKIDGKGYRTYVLMGDGEQQEGEVWEAAMSATKFKLDNLTAIIDRNGIQQDGLTEQIMPLEPLASKWRAFNWNVIEVDGYDYLQLIDAFDNAEMTKHRPTIIIAHTIKGKGISFMEWSPAYHGTPPSKDKMTDIYNELKMRMMPIRIAPSILAYDLRQPWRGPGHRREGRRGPDPPRRHRRKVRARTSRSVPVR